MERPLERPPHADRDRRLPPGTRRIVHADVDAFLASVEQALHPHLRGRAVVVGGHRRERNLVMSCSYEARAFGVRAGMPLGEAARRCPRAIFRRGDAQAANRLRERTARILLGFSPQVEVASIDDFFVDLTGTHALHGSAFDAAVAMRARVWQALHLPLTLGIGTSRLVARLAGKLGKPGGVAEILPGQEAGFLAALPVEQLPGVGHHVGALLERFHVRTVGELRAVSREVLYASFGKLGLALYERARGLDSEPVEATYVEQPDGSLLARPPASIRRDSTFEPEEGRREIVEAMLAYVTERAAARLRAARSTARALEVRLVYVDTRPTPEDSSARPRDDDRGRCEFAARRTLDRPSDSTAELAGAARELLCSLPTRRALVKRVGLTLAPLAPRGGWQGHLFDEGGAAEDAAQTASGARASRPDRHRRLDDVLDRLRARVGFGRVLRGASAPLARTHQLERDGYRLRTPSLNQ
jgi:DNA polymerase-4